MKFHQYLQNRHRKFDKDRLALLLLGLPFIIFIFMFAYVPLFGWAAAFFNYKPGLPINKLQFTGLQYFRMLFTSVGGNVSNALINTLALSFFGLLCSVLPMVLAILLNEFRSTKFKRLSQTATTLPNFIGWVIVYSLAFALFSQQGLMNDILTKFGAISQPIRVLDNVKLVWFFQTALGVWKNTGWGAIIYFAAIAGIDQEQYEAATVDGAGRFAKVIHITLPGLLPTFFVLLLLGIGNILTAGGGLDQYLVFYNGLTAPKIETLDYFVYRVGMLANNYSYAIAVGIVKSVISLTLLFSVNFLSKKVRGQSIF